MPLTTRLSATELLPEYSICSNRLICNIITRYILTLRELSCTQSHVYLCSDPVNSCLNIAAAWSFAPLQGKILLGNVQKTEQGHQLLISSWHRSRYFCYLPVDIRFYFLNGFRRGATSYLELATEHPYSVQALHRVSTCSSLPISRSSLFLASPLPASSTATCSRN